MTVIDDPFFVCLLITLAVIWLAHGLDVDRERERAARKARADGYLIGVDDGHRQAHADLIEPRQSAPYDWATDPTIDHARRGQQPGAA